MEYILAATMMLIINTHINIPSNINSAPLISQIMDYGEERGEEVVGEEEFSKGECSKQELRLSRSYYGMFFLFFILTFIFLFLPFSTLSAPSLFERVETFYRRALMVIVIISLLLAIFIYLLLKTSLIIDNFLKYLKSCGTQNYVHHSFLWLIPNNLINNVVILIIVFIIPIACGLITLKIVNNIKTKKNLGV
jgi:hypothetical protein